jgi:hypothetical protein
MKLPGLKSRVSSRLPGFAGLPTLRSGRHSSPGLKAWGFLAGFINVFAATCRKLKIPVIFMKANCHADLSDSGLILNLTYRKEDDD